MDDLIRRGDVLDKVVIYPNYSENGLSVDTYVVFDDDVMSIPAVDAVEVRHGRWMQNDNGTWSCSECSSWIPDEQHYYARFCLHCGARMDGRSEEEP